MPGEYRIPAEAIVSSGQGPKPMTMLAQLRGLIPFGGPEDIELPNESGMVDPRVPQTGSALLNAFRQSNKYAGERGAGTAPIDALRKLGR